MQKNYLKFGVILATIALAIVGFVFAGQFTNAKTVDVSIPVETAKTSETKDFHSQVAKSYDFRFGEDDPFAPGNATTYNGQFIDPKDFIPSARCASCHTDIHPQWEESAHAKSFVDPFYQKNVIDLQEQKNIAFTRHCESCHNPVALFSGSLTDEPFVKGSVI